MTYLPTNVFQNILAYCDDRVEQRQRRLWKSIKIIRDVSVSYDGRTTCINYSSLTPCDIEGFKQLIEWNEIDVVDMWEENGCLVDILESDDYWNHAINDSSYRQDRRYPLSNFINNKTILKYN